MKRTASSNAPKTISNGVGRRKAAVARVWLHPGSGKVVVNGKEAERYFDTEVSRKAAVLPMTVYHAAKTYDVEVNVKGGGLSAQADATKLGIARAFLKIDEQAKAVLRENDLLTVDARLKERKKYGQKAARRRFQFVKR
jgi:small subunit ribosomal protein S9